MNQLKRRPSLQRQRFDYDKASVALDVWDSVVGHLGQHGPPIGSISIPHNAWQDQDAQLL
jgi:hypothetical protein